jgi:NDP-sugar pyrophosphorylase family protein
MLDINGTPNLLRNILIMRDQLDIRDIYIVIGYQGEYIREYFGDGHGLNVRLTYIENNCLDKGMAYSIFLAKEYIDDYFCVILSDECYMNSNHQELTSFRYDDAIATCGIMQVDDGELIKRNYSVAMDGGRIVKLIEKPKQVTNDILGCGTFILNPRIFQFLQEAFDTADTESVDFITLLDELCERGEKILHFTLTGTYVNINDRDSLHLARYYERARIFHRQIITLLLYAEGDEEDIAFAIERYKEIKRINHIFVVLPHENSIENIVRDCNVSMIKCSPNVLLYGEKLKYAMERVPGDILILAEANYSFPGRDISKLLVYLKEADMVIGTRTTRQLIEQGSEMRGIVRLANILLAKLLEFLWWNVECRFSDVGCTFRAIWKSNFHDIKDRLVSKGPEFSVEMMIEALRARDRVIEIPVNYFNRSQSMYRKYQNFNTFLKMFSLICRKSISRILGSRKR